MRLFDAAGALTGDPSRQFSCLLCFAHICHLFEEREKERKSVYMCVCVRIWRFRRCKIGFPQDFPVHAQFMPSLPPPLTASLPTPTSTGTTSRVLSWRNRQRSAEFGNSYIEINRAKAMQLEREKSKAGTRERAVGRLTLHVWPRKTKQKPFGAPAAPAGELTSKWGRGLENLTMPGGRRVTTTEAGQKRSFSKREAGPEKREGKSGPIEKDEVLLKVSSLIPAAI